MCSAVVRLVIPVISNIETINLCIYTLIFKMLSCPGLEHPASNVEQCRFAGQLCFFEKPGCGRAVCIAFAVVDTHTSKELLFLNTSRAMHSLSHVRLRVST